VNSTIGNDLTAEMAVLAASRSDTYAFLSSFFMQLPDNSFVERIRELGMNDWSTDLDEDGFAELIQEGFQLIQNYASSIIDIPAETVLLDISRDRTKLIRGVMKGYGPPPPYEFAYAGFNEASRIRERKLAQLHYEEAGVGLKEEVKSSPDFIGVELDFMRYLTLTEAKAWEEERIDEACEMLHKQQAFLQEHLVSWVPKYCELMFEDAQLDFYRGVARLIKGFVLYENERVTEYLNEAESNKTIT